MKKQKTPTRYPFGFQRSLRPIQLNNNTAKSDFFEIRLASRRRRQKLARNVRIALVIFFTFWVMLFS